MVYMYLLLQAYLLEELFSPLVTMFTYVFIITGIPFRRII